MKTPLEKLLEAGDDMCSRLQKEVLFYRRRDAQLEADIMQGLVNSFRTAKAEYAASLLPKLPPAHSAKYEQELKDAWGS